MSDTTEISINLLSTGFAKSNRIHALNGNRETDGWEWAFIPNGLIFGPEVELRSAAAIFWELT